MKYWRFAALFGSIILAISLSACEFSLAADITPPPGAIQPSPVVQQPQPSAIGDLYPLVAPKPDYGAAIFAEKCSPCHGVQGLGNGPQAAQLPNPVPPIGQSDLARKTTPAEWYEIVTYGNIERYMPPFSSLDEGERWDVVSHAFTLSMTPEEVREGESLFATNCAECHGSQGQMVLTKSSTNTQVSFSGEAAQEYMAGMSADGLYAAIQQGAAPAMPAFVDRLTESETWALTAYLRSLSFSSTSSNNVAEVPESTSETVLPIQTPEATPVAEAVEPRLGLIAGQLVNGSGGETPSGLTITLHGLDQMQVIITETTTLQESGRFEFEDVEFEENRVFVVTTEYEGATYGSDIAVVEPGVDSLELPVIVYDTTLDQSILVVDRLHVFFDFPTEDVIQIVELLVISNPTAETLVAEKEGDPVVQFDLPEGAQNLQFQDGMIGERYIETPGGFADTVAVRPGTGEYQVMYAYEMPYERRKLDLVQSYEMPLEAVIVMAPAEGVKVKSDVLQDAGTREVQGVNFSMYTGGLIPAGEPIDLSITGRPSGSDVTNIMSTPTSSTNLVIGLAAMGIVLIIAGIWLYRRNQAVEPDSEMREEFEEEETLDDPETIVDAIIALDELFGEGELPVDAYQQRREKLKARLKELTS